MKKRMNYIGGIVGSIVMVFGILFFLAIMEDDDSESSNPNDGITIPETKPPESSEQVNKPNAEQDKEKEEQIAKDKAEAEKKAKAEQVAKEKAKAEAEKKAKAEQAAKEKAEAENAAKKEPNNQGGNNASNPNTKPPNKGEIKPPVPDPNEDYEKYLESIGVKKPQTESVDFIEGENMETEKDPIFPE